MESCWSVPGSDEIEGIGREHSGRARDVEQLLESTAVDGRDQRRQHQGPEHTRIAQREEERQGERDALIAEDRQTLPEPVRIGRRRRRSDG